MMIRACLAGVLAKAGGGVAHGPAVERHAQRRIARDGAVLAAGLLPRRQGRRIPDFQRQGPVVARDRTALFRVEDVGPVPVGGLDGANADVVRTVAGQFRRRRRHGIDAVLLRAERRRCQHRQDEERGSRSLGVDLRHLGHLRLTIICTLATSCIYPPAAAYRGAAAMATSSVSSAALVNLRVGVICVVACAPSC